MAIPEVGKFILQQNGGYVARTQFNYTDSDGISKVSLQTGNQLAGQTYHVDPGELGVPDGMSVQLYLWVMAGYDQTSDRTFIYTAGSPVVATYTCALATVDPSLTFNGLMTVDTPHSVLPAQLELAEAVGKKIDAAIAAQTARSSENPVLVALAADPMKVLEENGLPADFLAGANSAVQEDFVSYLQAQAKQDITDLSKRQVTRGFVSCWACRIGFGLVVAAVGLVLSAVTVGAGGAIFIASVNFLVTWGVAMVTAEGIMTAAAVAGGVTSSGGIAALIEFVCETIPNTC